MFFGIIVEYWELDMGVTEGRFSKLDLGRRAKGELLNTLG